MINFLFRWFEQLTPQQWVLVLIGGVALGFLCLRGMGNRAY